MTAQCADRRTSLAVAAFLAVGIFALRVVNEDSRALISLLYVIPIALVAVELGMTWGLAAGALALVLFAVWDAGWNEHDLNAWNYMARGATFFLLGGLVGALADRLRTVSDESSRFWELSSDLLCTAGFDGYFKNVNPAWKRTLGWSANELTSRPFMHFVHEDDREETERESARLAGGDHETLVFENRYRCKDGSYRTILWSARPISDKGVVYGTGRDVTESKYAQAELRASERFLDSVLESLPNMVFVQDAGDLRYVRLNRAGEEFLGSRRKHLTGTPGDELFSNPTGDVFARHDREALAGDAVVDFPEVSVDTADGPRLIHTRKVAIRDERGAPRFLLGIAEDVTDQRSIERAGDAARAEAERANEAKNEFLSRMSHELRTPLNAVIGFGQLLQLDDMTPGQSEAVEQILKAGRHLLELINEVLDISRIESGTMSLSLEPVHLGHVLDEALSLIGPLADEVQVQLAPCPARCADLHVLADQQRLKQVLINLLSNAVKYNRHGGTVSVDCSELAEDRIEITVADTGRGMSAAQLERLFAPFDRLGAEGTDVEGTGLGLSLSRGLLEAMGGAIAAESEPEVGTTMRVRLHAAEEHQTETTVLTTMSAPANEAPRDGTTIVYIEDNLSNLKLVERLLARLPDVRLIPAMQGNLAIDLARQHQPDIILLDLHLPDANGRDVLDQLKRDPATAAIPVVVLSADANPARFARLRAGGAAGYLTKPIDPQSLLEVVRNRAGTTPTSGAVHTDA
jgi:PAS domain S-box-containing protein